MGKSPAKKGEHKKGRSSPHPQQSDDYGRETETTKTGTTIVADVKGGSGNRGDDDDKGRRHHSPRSRKDDGGRGTETTQPGSTVVADVKGGTGQHGGGKYDPKH